MALTQAIVEYIHHNIHAKTLFSTQYHELTSMESTLERLKNIHVRAEKYKGNVVFLHQIKEGAADESYGIHVAKLANLPDQLIERATVILAELEKTQQKNIDGDQDHLGQLSLFVEEVTSKPQQANERKHHDLI